MRRNSTIGGAHWREIPHALCVIITRHYECLSIRMHNDQQEMSQREKIFADHCSALIKSITSALAIVALVNTAQAFFDDDIPPQKMVMSHFRAQKTPEKHLQDQTTEELGKRQPTQESTVHTQDMAISSLVSRTNAATQSHIGTTGQNTIVDPAPVSEDMQKTVPYVNLKAHSPSTRKVHQSEPVDQINNSPQSILPAHHSFAEVIRWVHEASTTMFTYSGQHLNRDKKNAAQYFSPKAWRVIEDALFLQKDSPLQHLGETRGSSRALSLDWPKSLHTDVNEHGKLWWLLVPIVVEVQEKETKKRAFYEVKLGVLDVQGPHQARLIVDELVIRNVSRHINTAQKRR